MANPSIPRLRELFRPLNPPIKDWTGRTVWLVGGSEGIGLALGRELLRRGAQLIVSGRRQDRLLEAFPEPTVCKIACDIAKPEDLEQACATLSKQALIPDAVFWVAGVYSPMQSWDFDPFEAEQTLRINLLACYHGLRQVLNLWQAHEQPNFPRHWVWVSSVAGYRGLPLAMAYGASKAGLNQLAEVNYLELRPRGIGVSLVLPGFVKTRLTAQNDFAMPSLLSPEDAAQLTLKGLARGDFEIHYPRRFTRLLKVLRCLPYGLYFRLVGRLRQE
jgi:NAD(P)-dependent dehydrogenase (short-subunit alcohol dehydrogenase family)